MAEFCLDDAVDAEVLGVEVLQFAEALHPRLWGVRDRRRQRFLRELNRLLFRSVCVQLYTIEYSYD